jgi:hypothetical protein
MRTHNHAASRSSTSGDTSLFVGRNPIGVRVPPSLAATSSASHWTNTTGRVSASKSALLHTRAKSPGVWARSNGVLLCHCPAAVFVAGAWAVMAFCS